MGRLFTPFQQFFNKNRQPLSGGTLEFLMNNTDLRQDTFSDANLNNENTNPVVLDGEGRVPNVFGDGVYTVVLKDKDGILIDRLNEVGGDPGSRTAFSDWTSTIIYNIPALVVGSDGKYYENLSNGNLGNDPVSNPKFWSEIRFMDIWSEFVTYSSSNGDVAQSANGSLWRSQTDGNLNKPPESDDGTNWLPAIDGSKVPEVIELNARNLWNGESAAFSVLPNRRYQIDASSAAVDGALPTSLSEGDEMIVHNESVSTNTVRLTNTALTLRGVRGTITTSDNLVLEPGDTAYIAMKTATDGEFA